MMHRRLASALAVLLLLAGTFSMAAQAQTAAFGAPPAVAPPAISPGEVDALVTTLEDPVARAKLIEQLRVLSAAQPAGGEASTDAAGLVERFLADLSAGISAIGDDVGAAALALNDLPQVTAWFARQLHDPRLVEAWSILFVKLALVLAAAILADWLVERATRRARERLDAPRADGGAVDAVTWVGRAAGLLVRALLSLLPIVGFVAAAYLALALVHPDRVTRPVMLAVIHANVLARAILAIARLLLAQRDTAYRLLRLSEETAAYGYLWIRRLATVAIYGFCLIVAGQLIGLPLGIYHGALRVLGLVLTTMVVILVLQNRTAVADWLRDGRPRGAGPRAAAAGLGRRLADVWHVLVILYVAAIYLVWALGVVGGFIYLVRGTALSLLILALSRIGTSLLRRAIDRGFAVGADLTQRLPGLEARANRYLPVLNAVLRGAIYLVASVALLQAWGADSFAWLGSPVGRRMLSSALAILIVVAAAVFVWEVLALAIERYLGETDEAGNRLPRSARARTLLPLLRNAALILILVMVSLTVMSEIGLDIAPLLAGAGVVGLAIGFGAQTLVKDVITGLFILIEDTINVGDVVQVDQRTGTVESISIRSIRIRDAEGAVHTVPFSAVSTVKNLTKGFSYYLFDIAVGQSADLDAVTALLRRIDAEVRADPAFTDDILEPLDVQGVDRLTDAGLVLRARIKTLPGRQYTVGREFNRRIVVEFAAAGVPTPLPRHTIEVTGWPGLPKPAPESPGS
jgi:small-conductance mechanosensitive channel